MGEFDFLNVYGQKGFHDNVYILGSRTALILLREAIEQAIKNNTGHCHIHASDGESYFAHVAVVDETEASQLETPYIDEWCNAFSEGDQSPLDFLERTVR